MQQFASSCNLGLAIGVGEQSVMAAAMKARRQHMQQEEAHELLRLQRQGFLARAAVFAVVLPAEGDAAIKLSDEPRVGDGDPVRVARQVRQRRLGACERALGVDHLLAPTHGCEPVGKCLGIGESEVPAEE